MKLDHQEQSKPRGRGRPTIYNDELGARILDRMAEGQSLRTICRAPEMPSAATVRNWILDPEACRSGRFLTHYAHARAMLIDRWSEEVVDLSDESVGLDIAGVQAKRLQVDARKWILSKLRPEKFGNLVKVECDKGPELHIYLPDNSRGATDRPRLLPRDDEESQ